jgi:hypothetical protein
MDPLRSVVAGPELPPPIGPYSQAVRAGALLFVSGQPGLDPATGEVAGESFGEEARQAFRNLETVLRAGARSWRPSRPWPAGSRPTATDRPGTPASSTSTPHPETWTGG